MKHQPVTDDHLKKNASIWKRLFSPSVPDLSPGNIAVMLVVLAAAIIVVINVYPKQSTRDFKAVAVNTSQLRFTDTKLAVYNNMRVSIVRRSSGGSLSGRTITGGSSVARGVLLKGNITNISDQELFLTVGYPPSSIRTGDRLGLNIIVDGHTQSLDATLQIKDAAYMRGGDKGAFAGYYIKPGDKLAYEVISRPVEIEPQENVEMGLHWIVIDAETFEARTASPNFAFRRDGSSLVWGDGLIQWVFPPPKYRTN